MAEQVSPSPYPQPPWKREYTIKKTGRGNWDAAIFAQAGLERIGLRPENSQIIEWMLPAPAQGAIVVRCPYADAYSCDAFHQLNVKAPALCTKTDLVFLRALHGSCSTPITALAVITDKVVYFKGNILSLDGSQIIE